MHIDTEAANAVAKRPAVEENPVHGEEQSPLLETFVGQDAPPTYLEATTPMGWRGEAMGLLNEERPVLTPMREEGHMDGRYRRRSLRDQFSRKRVKVAAALLPIVLLALIILALAHRDKKSPVVTPIPAQPAQSEVASQPVQPELPTKPIKGKESFPIRWPAQCGKKNYNVKSEERIFGTPSEVNIVEAVHQLDGQYKRVLGWVHVTQGSPEQAAGTIEAKLSYAVTNTVDVNSIKYSWAPNGLTIGDPSFPDGFDGIRKGEACLGISVVLYMAAGTKMENFKVRSIHMGMQIHEGATFEVTNGTSITLTTGTLDASSIISRETHLETISGSISGKYALRDLLSIVTRSGSVNINVDPKEKAAGGSKKALFYANTMSGSIRVDTERRHIPERDYIVSINSTAGSVDGTFIHGTKTEMNSVAGSINIDLVPYGPGDSASDLTTKTTDGEINVTLRGPYNAPGTALTKLTSTHKSISGQVNIRYPQEWAGHLDGQSTTGKLHLRGKDLELLKEVEEPGLSHVEAKQGNGASSMVFKTLNGECDVQVGQE